MLDLHHRAAYRIHHALLPQLGKRRVYYVVSSADENGCDVRVIRCQPNSPKSELPVSDLQNAKCFTACGTEIRPLTDGKGRYDVTKTFQQHEIRFQPLAAAA